MIDSLSQHVTRHIWPEPNSGCWLWGGYTNRKGYGITGKRGLAHRVVFEAATGTPIQDGFFACHRCDNPSCVNPDHIFIGTHADNMRDKSSKGRQTRGEKHYTARLKASDVAKIRAAYLGGETQSSISRRFGVSQGHVSMLCNSRQWAHIGPRVPVDPAMRTRRAGECNGQSKLTRVQVDEIRELRKTMTQRAVAAKFGVSQATISNIVTGRVWR